MQNKKITILEENYAPILKTGDRFLAKYKTNPEIEYEFIGFAPFDNCGCQYIILKNVETGSCIGVERMWFDVRRIWILKGEKK